VGAALALWLAWGVGVMIGLFKLMLRAGLVRLVAALFHRSPKIALLPLFVIWFGIDEAVKYA